MYIYIYIHAMVYDECLLLMNSFNKGAYVEPEPAAAKGEPTDRFGLYKIVITNIVWCMAYSREVGGRVVYCPIVVQ